MFKTNSYFENKVVSIAFKNEEGNATVGVMAPGEYLFNTSTIEYMTVISGEMKVKRNGDSLWKTYEVFQTFKIEADSSFKVVIKEETSYKCIYK